MSESPSTSGEEKIIGDWEIGDVFLNIQGDCALHIGMVEGDMVKYEWDRSRRHEYFRRLLRKGKK